MSKEILAIIPARGGSKGIPHKNIALLDNKPLIQYTIEAALGSEYITRATVNSDDEEILAVAKAAGAEVYVRPAEYAQDDTPMKDVILDELATFKAQGYEPDIIILLQPTSPLRTAAHIDEAMASMLREDCDALVSVEEEPHLHSPYSVMRLNEEGCLEFFLPEGQRFTDRRQKPKFYARNGAAIYAVTVDAYYQTGSLYGTKCIPYVMDHLDSVDIDEPFDLYMANCIMQYKKDQQR